MVLLAFACVLVRLNGQYYHRIMVYKSLHHFAATPGEPTNPALGRFCEAVEHLRVFHQNTMTCRRVGRPLSEQIE
jgi:hypothetical protein